MKKIKITSLCLALAILISVLAGCSKTEPEIIDDYSIGLTEDGLYKNLDSYPCELPDFTSMAFSYEEILQWCVDNFVNANDTDIKTIDDYVYLCGEEFLANLGLTQKDIVDEGDIAHVTLEFYMNGTLLENYGATSSYKAVSDGDVIVNSFIGHKADDIYEVEYVFPEDHDEYPSKTATVKITIKAVLMANPLECGVVENNLDALKEYLPDVVDKETFLQALRPELAKASLKDFMESQLQDIEGVEAPQEYTNHEVQRLKFRLSQIGYTYSEYLKTVNMTEDEVEKYCAMVAKENYIAMLVFKTLDRELTDEDVKEYYGDNLEYVESIQGRPYMRLKMMREIAIHVIAQQVALNEEGVLEPNGDNVENVESTDVTTVPNE